MSLVLQELLREEWLAAGSGKLYSVIMFECVNEAEHAALALARKGWPVLAQIISPVPNHLRSEGPELLEVSLKQLTDSGFYVDDHGAVRTTGKYFSKLRGYYGYLKGY